jgi:hypothetical protein
MLSLGMLKAVSAKYHASEGLISDTNLIIEWDSGWVRGLSQEEEVF